MLHLNSLSGLASALKENNPFLLKHDFGLKELINEKAILKEYGDLYVTVPKIIENERISNLEKMETIKVTLNEYVERYLNKKNNKYYLRSESPFGFQKPARIHKLKKSLINKYGFGRDGNISFWWGSAGTTTPLHYDSYDYKIDNLLKKLYGNKFYENPLSHSLLSVVSGSKKILLISPEYESHFESKDVEQSGAMYSGEKISEIFMKNNIKKDIIILKENETLNIPRFWWHRVSNLEQGISITYNFKL